jgi:predicted DNA-binding transcriptional regulator AlpA
MTANLNTAALDPLLTGKEAAPMLGMSYQSFLRHVREGWIPKPLKMGALSRWPQSEILAVIEKAKAERGTAA